MESIINLFSFAVRDRWEALALTDFRRGSRTYGRLAQNIATWHLVWEAAGLKWGDKIAVNAHSCSNWTEVFMAAVTGGYVSVQLFNGFLPSDTQKLVAHSDSRILFTQKDIFAAMDWEQMPQLLAAIDIDSMEILASRADFRSIYESREALLSARYPAGMKPEDVCYPDIPMDEVCAIMYTSGSTGSPKGVMLTVRNFSWNVMEIPRLFPYHKNENYTSILPYAHIFGLTCDALIPMCLGMHTIILGRPPIPSNVQEIMQEYHPRIFLAVPLILSKFVEYTVGREMKSPEGAAKLADCKSNRDYCNSLRDKVLMALGGRIESFATGGAAIPPDIESLLAFKIGMPFLTGYGMTECAPLIACGKAGSYKARSCGECVDSIDVRIDSPDPMNTPGEVQVRGDNVFKGYYKNPEATAASFTLDGWFRTGDLGTIDSDRTLFLVGRSKSMLLSANGQNIFPEEIEVVLNSLPHVAESLVVQRGNALHALIVPDGNTASDFDASTLHNIMECNVRTLNTKVPLYCSVDSFEIMTEPFAKTPKGSIKRFMYA